MRLFLFLIASNLMISCYRDSSPSRTKDEFSGASFLYYAKEDRLEIFRQLKMAMENNYALRDIKAKRIGVDTSNLFESFLSNEEKIENVEGSKAQAIGNLAFLDRVRKLIASYQDTHLSVKSLVAAPVIMNGLELREVDGKFYVAAMRKKLVEFAAVNSSVPEAYAKISLGDQILSIDGQPVDSLVARLMVYERASSDAFRRFSATRRLTTRDYAYPEMPFSDYEMIKNNGELYSVKLPYFYKNLSGATRADANYLLKELGFYDLKNLTLTWNEQDKTWDFASESIPVEGFDRLGQVPADLVGKQEWVNQDVEKDLALRTGFIIKGGKAYGVAQIFTFMAMAMENTATGEKAAFEAALKAFVVELKRSEIPLIIDIRNNGGGYTSLPAAVLAAIAKTGETYPVFTRAARVTRHIRQMMEAEQPSGLGQVGYDSELTAFDQLKLAISEGRSHTWAIDASDKIKSSIGGYDQPVVALITPNCISSCDITSMLFEASNRVTLLGTHSNGTGAGMTSSDPFTGPSWTDTFDVIKVNIPNFLFGRPGKMDAHIHAGSAFYDLNSENVPVHADIQYDYTIQDLFDGSRGWFSKAIEILSAQ